MFIPCLVSSFNKRYAFLLKFYSSTKTPLQNSHTLNSLAHNTLRSTVQNVYISKQCRCSNCINIGTKRCSIKNFERKNSTTTKINKKLETFIKTMKPQLTKITKNIKLQLPHNSTIKTNLSSNSNILISNQRHVEKGKQASNVYPNFTLLLSQKQNKTKTKRKPWLLSH